MSSKPKSQRNQPNPKALLSKSIFIYLHHGKSISEYNSQMNIFLRNYCIKQIYNLSLAYPQIQNEANNFFSSLVIKLKVKDIATNFNPDKYITFEEYIEFLENVFEKAESQYKEDILTYDFTNYLNIICAYRLITDVCECANEWQENNDKIQSLQNFCKWRIVQIWRAKENEKYRTKTSEELELMEMSLALKKEQELKKIKQKTLIEEELQQLEKEHTLKKNKNEIKEVKDKDKDKDKNKGKDTDKEKEKDKGKSKDKEVPIDQKKSYIYPKNQNNISEKHNEIMKQRNEMKEQQHNKIKKEQLKCSQEMKQEQKQLQQTMHSQQQPQQLEKNKDNTNKKPKRSLPKAPQEQQQIKPQLFYNPYESKIEKPDDGQLPLSSSQSQEQYFQIDPNVQVINPYEDDIPTQNQDVHNKPKTSIYDEPDFPKENKQPQPAKKAKRSLAKNQGNKNIIIKTQKIVEDPIPSSKSDPLSNITFPITYQSDDYHNVKIHLINNLIPSLIKSVNEDKINDAITKGDIINNFISNIT